MPAIGTDVFSSWWKKTCK